jgi:hypothetical protein
MCGIVWRSLSLNVRRGCVSELLGGAPVSALVSASVTTSSIAKVRGALILYIRHSRERGNPFVFQVNMDPRFRGDDVEFSVSFRGNDVSFSVPFVGMT